MELKVKFQKETKLIVTAEREEKTIIVATQFKEAGPDSIGR